ncbi:MULTISPECIES: ABC transporter permease [unclassified Janthinobacterium]|uniref:ABC transporter permease n=1 Tax=unclassified Janthinobacterium TaxID=2610881 RepID=UPI0003490609|nr:MULTISPECIES: ABC transporter permease [unclassified Janthinobacterium]MEC5160285.1 ABC-type transport system involved in multi-copper enzyme maturation permease subunit [Janthinobacterium sp. CG_S6]
MMLRPTLTIAAYTLLEALRNRLLWLLLLAALAGVGLAGFLHELALTEGREVQAALLAAALRLAAVFLVATFVVTSVVREADDKGLDMLLALPMPRAAYLFGKLAGFAALALLPALLFGALSLLFAAPAQSALWGLSLLCELWIVAAFSLLCALSFSQALPALAGVAGFYLLARVIGALQLLGHGQGGARSHGQRAIGAGLDLVAAVLPALDRYTRTEWLLYGSGDAATLLAIAAHSAIYLALLAAAALFDLYRKSL